jgi:acetyl-CoA decarbonylase/synthase complex subunit delta
MAEDLYRLLRPKLELPSIRYPGRISIVQLGATSQERGTRKRSVKIGGDIDFPFFALEAPTAVRPTVAMEVFDKPLGVPTPVRQSLGSAAEDPIEWAKKCARECPIDAIALRLISSDPALDDSSSEECAQLVKNLLEEVDLPLIVFGSGNDQKDPAVLERVAEAAEKERVLLSAATLKNDYKRIAQAASRYNHLILSRAECDPPSQRILNEHLLELGLNSNQIVMDPTTAALGYGIEYSISIMEQLRLDALKGDKSVQMPIAAITSYTWNAREAWSEDKKLGPIQVRGPLWETHTATSLFLAGAGLFIMLHPDSVRQFNKILSEIFPENPQSRLDG